jgi:predicted homoserine dehydrogenase-like protein
MNLHRLLLKRAELQMPVRVALIGAGKFGSMFLSQARQTPGIHIVAVADLDTDRARMSLARVGWPAERYAAASIDEAFRTGATYLTDDALALIAQQRVEIVVEATGNPAAGVRHALACAANGKHVVMVNVEADALAGPILARRAAEAGVIYSLAYGDQPALICEMVDWARTAGFDVVAAGKGTKYLPEYHDSTPDSVWGHYGFSDEQVANGDFNAQMFNSFLDGTKSAIEMAAVANAAGLSASPDGLAFPPCGVDDLPRVLKPRADGGVLQQRGQVEVVSSLQRDGTPVFRDLRWGVYVTFGADSDYVRRCFSEYGLVTDESGEYAAMYKPFHLIGLELGVSVASVGLRGEATGAPVNFHADAVAVAKRDLTAGEILDGEGGYTVYGRLVRATDSLRMRAWPIGLAHGVRLTRAVTRGQIVTSNDVAAPATEAARIRRELEQLHSVPSGAGASLSSEASALLR